MALDPLALLDLLAQLKLTNVTDRIRVATEALYQELSLRKRPRSSAPARSNVLQSAPPTEMALVHGC